MSTEERIEIFTGNLECVSRSLPRSSCVNIREILNSSFIPGRVEPPPPCTAHLRLNEPTFLKASLANVAKPGVTGAGKQKGISEKGNDWKDINRTLVWEVEAALTKS